MALVRSSIAGIISSILLGLGAVPALSAQQRGASSIGRTELLKQVLPPGNFRDVQASLIELAPGSTAARHRHDVAVLAYVVEGTVENRFNGGSTETHKAGQSWWEAPGTVHDLAHNPSQTERARLLIVYIGEPGKTPTVALK